MDSLKKQSNELSSNESFRSADATESKEIESHLGEFKFEEVNFSSRFFKSLSELRSEKSFCDISIKIDDQTIQAHRVVLAASIPYFKAMFNSNMMENVTNEIEIKEEHISHPVLCKIIDYAYSGEVTMNLENVQQICFAASFFCLKSILNASINFIIKHIDYTNVLVYKSFSKFFPMLEMYVEEFISEYFLQIYKTNEFLELSFEEILKIISNDELNIDEEEIVFEAVMNWLRADEQNRKQHICALLEHIRLPFISSEFIVDSIISQSYIKNFLKSRDIIDEVCINWHLLPQRRGLIQNHRTIKRSFTRKENPIICIYTAESRTYFESYDALKDQWQIYLTEKRQLKIRTSIIVLDNKIYSIGGYETGARTNKVEVFDLVDKKWSQIASLNEKRSALSSLTLDGKIYCLGGYDGSRTLSSAECYSFKQNKWVYLSNMMKCRCSSAAVVCNKSIYVIGGHDGLSIFSSVERYDPVFDRWILCKEMSKQRCRLGATALNGKIYVAGGFNGDQSDDTFEVYDPLTDCWKSLKPMLRARSRFSLISNGKRIFAIGGDFRNALLTTCEVYDIEKNIWTFVSQMNGQQNPTGTILLESNCLPK